MKLHAALRECAADLLDTEPHVTVEHIVSCAYQRHGEAFADAQERMVRAAARTIVANLMRDLSEDENEQQTFGFGGLPSAIAIPDENGTYYVRSDKATWEELVKGRAVRTANVAAAQAALDAYDETLATLQPYMEGTSRSVAGRSHPRGAAQLAPIPHGLGRNPPRLPRRRGSGGRCRVSGGPSPGGGMSARPACCCGHVQRSHFVWYGACSWDDCACLYFRPCRYKRQQPTAQGMQAPGGGEALPIQGQSEGTP